MLHGRQVLTTGEVARLCNVAPRTVSKWFDSGELRGFRIPGSRDRRIPVEQLIRFMRAHGIPLDGLDTSKRRMLIVDRDLDFTRTIHAALERLGGYHVLTARSAFEAGAVAQDTQPQVMVIDVRMTDLNAAQLAQDVHSLAVLNDALLIGVGFGLTSDESAALRRAGYGDVLAKPFDAPDLVAAMERAEIYAGM